MLVSMKGKEPRWKKTLWKRVFWPGKSCLKLVTVVMRQSAEGMGQRLPVKPLKPQVTGSSKSI